MVYTVGDGRAPLVYLFIRRINFFSFTYSFCVRHALLALGSGVSTLFVLFKLFWISVLLEILLFFSDFIRVSSLRCTLHLTQLQRQNFKAVIIACWMYRCAVSCPFVTTEVIINRQLVSWISLILCDIWLNKYGYPNVQFWWRDHILATTECSRINHEYYQWHITRVYLPMWDFLVYSIWRQWIFLTIKSVWFHTIRLMQPWKCSLKCFSLIVFFFFCTSSRFLLVYYALYF